MKFYRFLGLVRHKWNSGGVKNMVSTPETVHEDKDITFLQELRVTLLMTSVVNQGLYEKAFLKKLPKSSAAL